MHHMPWMCDVVRYMPWMCDGSSAAQQFDAEFHYEMVTFATLRWNAAEAFRF